MPVAKIDPKKPIQKQQQKKEQAPEVSDKPKVSAALPKDLPVVSKEERVEYRDEKGRVLDEEEVKALAGKVSFKTRYETRTRVVDAQGHEIHEALVEAREEEGGHGQAEDIGVAPPHPDVDGRNPETKEAGVPEPVASEVPPTVEVAEDVEKEKSVEQLAKEPKPASEAKAATVKEE